MELKEKLKAKMAQQKELLDKAVAEGRGLEAEEHNKFEGLEQEIADLERTIEAAENLWKREEQEETPVNNPVRPENKVKGFRNIGEQLKAVVQYFNGEGKDERLFKNLNESVPSEGGFFVEQPWANEMLTRMYEESPLLARIDRTTLTGNANGIKYRGVVDNNRTRGNRWGGIQTYWLEERGTLIPSNPEFRKVELELNKLAGLCYLTNELLEDAGALSAEVENWFREDMDFEIANAIIRGNGQGKPQGVLNSPALVSVDPEAGQAADTVVYENIVNMWSRMPARMRQRAVWYINQDIEPQLFTMSLAVGTGGVPVYMPPNGAADSPYGRLFGRPVVPIEQAATLGDEGDIILADMSQYKGIDKGGVDQATSIHVRFLTDETALRFIYRFDGQGKWDEPITPAQGTNTLSPFVVLGERV